MRDTWIPHGASIYATSVWNSGCRSSSSSGADGTRKRLAESLTAARGMKCRPLRYKAQTMSNPNKPVKWHQMDEAAARALTEATEDPCGVFPMPPSSVPESLQKIDGIGSYFASG